jgi:hypothetical protein
MKSVFLSIVLVISSFINAQNVIEVSISQIGIFAKYGRDSLHLMIAKSECGHYSRSYDPIDLKLVINKSKKKIYRYKNGQQTDSLPIKKLQFKDSIYTIIVTEVCNPRYAEYEGQLIDCYLVLDTRINRIDKNIPKFCYYWNYKFTINDEPMDYYTGRVTDHVKIN